MVHRAQLKCSHTPGRAVSAPSGHHYLIDQPMEGIMAKQLENVNDDIVKGKSPLNDTHGCYWGLKLEMVYKDLCHTTAKFVD